MNFLYFKFIFMPNSTSESKAQIGVILNGMLDSVEVSAVLDDLKSEVVAAASMEDRFGETSVELCLDYDNCIGNAVGEKLTPEALVAADVQFWDEVYDELHAETKGLPNDRRCITSGSARQSKACDDTNIQNNDSTSSFELYDYLAGHLESSLDKLLLSDIKENLPTGTSWDRATDSEYTESHEDWYFDESKITLLYARMHRASMCNPNGHAIFIFYDDREDILDALYHFFNENIDLVPPNIELRLRRRDQYDNISYEHSKIWGESENTVDVYYKETTRVIGAYIDSLSKEVPFYDAETNEEGVYTEYLSIPDIIGLNLGQVIYNLRVAYFETENKATEDESVSSASLSDKIDSEETAKAVDVSPVHVGHMIFKPVIEEHADDQIFSQDDDCDSVHTI